jgi:hypothetical protein
MGPKPPAVCPVHLPGGGESASRPRPLELCVHAYMLSTAPPQISAAHEFPAPVLPLLPLLLCVLVLAVV